MDSMSNLPKYKMFIGGEWVAARSDEWFETFDPYAGKPWALVARGGKADADSAVDAAHNALDGSRWAIRYATLPPNLAGVSKPTRADVAALKPRYSSGGPRLGA
jgi:hypothetical protein